jgi:hypothetical protein
MSEIDSKESVTYRHSWIIIMISKKPEDVQWVVETKLGNVMMVFEPCRRV